MACSRPCRYHIVWGCKAKAAFQVTNTLLTHIGADSHRVDQHRRLPKAPAVRYILQACRSSRPLTPCFSLQDIELCGRERQGQRWVICRWSQEDGEPFMLVLSNHE